MKFRFEAIFGYEIIAGIQISMPDEPRDHKTLKLWENQAGTITHAMNTPGRDDKIFSDKQFE